MTAIGFDDLVLQGLSARSAGDHSVALERFENAAELNVEHIGIQLEIALTLIYLGRFDDAANSYYHVLTKEPNNALALAGMGYIERARENHGQAAEWFRLAAQADPLNLEVQTELAAELRSMSRFEEAEVIYCNIFDHEPGHFGALVGFAIALRRRGRRSEALAIFLELLESNPTHVGLLYESAHTLTEMADFERATEIYRRILEMLPNDPVATGCLDRNLRRARQIRQA